MERETVQVFDTSLRDGLRNSGITMTLEQKLQFVQQLEQLNVDVIEIGYGGPSQIETMRRLAEAVTNPVVVGLARVNLKDVRRVLEGVASARKPGINVFIPASDVFLTKAKLTRQQAVDATVKAVSYAKQHLDHVEVSAQDAARADPGYLVVLFRAVVEAGATVLSIPDSTSYAVPQQFGPLCAFLRQQVPISHAGIWSVHCHNELGLAVANSLAAIEHGVRRVECTVNGIGEGAGNTPLHRVLNALRTRDDVFTAVTTNIAFEQLPATSRMLSEIVREECLVVRHSD
jgi:2-isopropylmalate synthase